jgi:hypothetical protein
MSVTSMLRAMNKPQDEWMTPDYAVKPLLPYLKATYPSPVHNKATILCPFDKKDSAFVRVLRNSNHIVIHSHINDRRKMDFFDYTHDDVLGVDFIISNPPYSIKDKVFDHLFKLGKPFAMLMGATAGLFEGKRFSLFKDKELEIMWLKPRVAYIDQEGKTMKSPPFQSCYVCHKILPKSYLFVELERK